MHHQSRRILAAFGPLILVMTLVTAGRAFGADSYSGGQLTAQTVTLGGATFTNVVVTISGIVSGPSGSAPVGSVDVFDPVKRHISVPAVTVGANTYYNVVAKVAGLVSIGSVSGVDTVSGANPFILTIPAVQILGGATYSNIVVSVGSVRSLGGGLPASATDVYDPATQLLTVAAVEVGGRVYTNAVVSIGAILSEISLHAFGVVSSHDGEAPAAGLIQGTDGLLYGTTSAGGPVGAAGTVFSLTTGGQETLLHGFTGGIGPNKDGRGVGTPLIQASDGNYYGTTAAGGQYGYGTVYQVTAQGGYSVLYSFAGGPLDGATPSSVIQGSDGNLYGTTASGGASGGGTVFTLSLSGLEALLYSFVPGTASPHGYAPGAALVEGTDGNFYGTTNGGGNTPYGIYGTIFRITPAGVLTTLYAFNNVAAGAAVTDASGPFSPLTQGSDGNFYGTSPGGGTADAGTVYRVTPAGVETVIHSFVGNTLNGGTNADGERPSGGLIEGSPGTFYGVTEFGGAFADSTKSAFGGTIFKVTSQGDESVLYSFGTFPKDGMAPSGALLHAKDGFYYGTTNLGGQFGYGMVFRIAEPVP
jgi:uncharacterized repeat protein (TIGR03803 family)